MKTITAARVLTICLVLIFTIGPAAAGVFDQLINAAAESQSYLRESGKFTVYMSSDQYSLLESRFAKPNMSLFSDQISKSDVIEVDIPEKDLWKSSPVTGPYCPTCGFKNATKSFGSLFTEDYSAYASGKSSFFFGGGAGGAPAGGGGCCG